MAAPQAARTQEKLATAKMQSIAGTPTTVRMPATTSGTKATAENAFDTRDSSKSREVNYSENIRN
jgi:hypothetical protein